MLKKEYRLKNRKAFDATYKNKKVLSNSLLTLYLGKEKTEVDYPTKVGFVVSKKYHKRAVKRNRIRRLMREVCRLAIKDNNFDKLNKYRSFILIPKIDTIGLNYQDIKTAFYNLMERVKWKY